jgi:hypothetical protein
MNNRLRNSIRNKQNELYAINRSNNDRYNEFGCGQILTNGLMMVCILLLLLSMKYKHSFIGMHTHTHTHTLCHSLPALVPLLFVATRLFLLLVILLSYSCACEIVTMLLFFFFNFLPQVCCIIRKKNHPFFDIVK